MVYGVHKIWKSVGFLFDTLVMLFFIRFFHVNLKKKVKYTNKQQKNGELIPVYLFLFQKISVFFSLATKYSNQYSQKLYV